MSHAYNPQSTSDRITAVKFNEATEAEGRIDDTGLYPTHYADYIVFVVGATYYKRNRQGVVTTGASKAIVQQAAVDALGSGGTILLQENELDGGVTYGNNILIVEHYQGEQQIYTNQGRYLSFPILAADPATAGWGNAEFGRWWGNSAEGKLKYWNKAAIVSFPSAGGAGAPVDASYVTINAEGGLDAEIQHANIVNQAQLHIAKFHKDTHKTGGTDPFAVADLLDGIARTTIRKNAGANVGSRRRINFTEGANVTLTVTDDAGSEEVDVTIASAAGGGGTYKLMPCYTVWRSGATYYARDQDGTQTSNASFNTLIDACIAAGASYIFIRPLGTGTRYILDDYITIEGNLWIQGGGKNCTFLELDNNLVTSTAFRSVGTSIRAFTLTDMTIDGNSAGQGANTDPLIYVETPRGNVYERLWVFDSCGHGIHLGGNGGGQGYCNWIINNDISENEQYGITINNCDENLISGNQIHLNGWSGLYESAGFTSIENNVFTSNSLNDQTYYSLYVYNSFDEIRNNIFDWGRGGGIYLRGGSRRYIVTGNLITCKRHVFAIKEWSTNTPMIITDNYIDGTFMDANNTYDVFHVEANVVPTRYVDFSHNIIQGDGTNKYRYFINTAGTSVIRDWKVHHNEVINVTTLMNVNTGSYDNKFNDNSFNPINQIATPFDNTNDRIGWLVGNSAVPASNKTYTVMNTPLKLSSSDSGSADCEINIYDGDSVQINLTADMSTIEMVYLPIGFQISWGVYTGANPTVGVFGA